MALLGHEKVAIQGRVAELLHLAQMGCGKSQVAIPALRCIFVPKSDFVLGHYTLYRTTQCSSFHWRYTTLQMIPAHK